LPIKSSKPVYEMDILRYHNQVNQRNHLKIKVQTIYLSNEETTPIEVYFDDFKVTYTKSPVVQMDEYYPFGLAFNSYSRENGISQDYKYNGKENQDELGIGWLDYGARMYMPDIGKWGVIDPLSEISRRWSPYVYCYNNPLRFTDPDGMIANDETGSSKIQIHNSSRLTQVRETTTKSNTVERTVKSSDKDFSELLGKSKITTDGANGVGNEIVERTTTTVTTVTEVTTLYDGDGKILKENSLQSTTASTTTEITVKDQYGGTAGGSKESKDKNPTYAAGTKAKISEALANVMSEVHDYKAGRMNYQEKSLGQKYWEFITSPSDKPKKNRISVGAPHR